MSDATQIEAVDDGLREAFKVPIAKAGNATVEVYMDEIGDEMYRMIIAEGLKAVLNKKMSKITGVTKLVGDEQSKAHTAALEIANKNLADLKAGKLKAGRAASASDKIDRVTQTEAMRLAREAVKDVARKAGVRISTIAASEITAAAKELITSDPSYVERAKANVEARAAKTTDAEAAKAALEKLGGLKEDPKLVAKAEKAAEERKAQLSAKQAGKVAPRKAPAQAHAH